MDEETSRKGEGDDGRVGDDGGLTDPEIRRSGQMMAKTSITLTDCLFSNARHVENQGFVWRSIIVSSMEF
jgi:hypothetical protein